MSNQTVTIGILCLIVSTILSCSVNQKDTMSTIVDDPDQCRRVSELKLPHTVVTLAQPIPAGGYIAPDGKTYSVPAFCRVQGVAVPTQSSHIKFEVWMPENNWNGRFYHIGTGGFSGDIKPFSGDLVVHIKQGNAVTITDSGHERTGDGLDASWALHHPEQIIDYGYRALKETTNNAKLVINAFYQQEPRYAYFAACSGGGRQAMKLARDFPKDWDGILIGAPANNFHRIATGAVWNFQALQGKPESQIPVAKLPAIQKAALASCTADAQVIQGVAADPRFCRLDARTMICHGEESDNCLTDAQAIALNKIYEGPRDPRTGGTLFPGFESTLEAESGWERWIIAAEPKQSQQYRFAKSFFSYMVFDDPDWDVHSLNYDKDIAFSLSKNVLGQSLPDILNAESPNLVQLQKQGSKVLLYHGWGDAGISAKGTVEDYELAAKSFGGIKKIQNIFRLFMVPGMRHCAGGPGATSFGQPYNLSEAKNDASHNILRALEAWVEQDVAPEKIIATKYINDKPADGIAFTRPICPYPQIPVYSGAGSINQASSFECKKGASPEPSTRELK